MFCHVFSGEVLFILLGLHQSSWLMADYRATSLLPLLPSICCSLQHLAECVDRGPIDKKCVLFEQPGPTINTNKTCLSRSLRGSGRHPRFVQSISLSIHLTLYCLRLFPLPKKFNFLSQLMFMLHIISSVCTDALFYIEF